MPLKWKDDYVLWSMRNDTSVKVRGDAVFVGYGIVAPEVGWNDYAGLDAKGKIVVALVNDPGIQDSSMFRGKILTYYGRWTYKIEEARRQGAAGLLIIHTTESATYPWTTVLSGWTGPAGSTREPARLADRGGLAPGADRGTAVQGRRPGSHRPYRRRCPEGLQAGPARHHAGGIGAKRDPPHRDRERPGPASGPRPPRQGSGADRRALRSVRDQRAARTGIRSTTGPRTTPRAPRRCSPPRRRSSAAGSGPSRSLVFVAFAAEESGLHRLPGAGEQAAGPLWAT